jgi:phage shock protein C
MENHKLYRTQNDKMIGGVCSGLARYLNIDVTIVRFLAILMALFGGHGLLVYVILWLVMPMEPTVLLPPNQP